MRPQTSKFVNSLQRYRCLGAVEKTPGGLINNSGAKARHHFTRCVPPLPIHMIRYPKFRQILQTRYAVRWNLPLFDPIT